MTPFISEFSMFKNIMNNSLDSIYFKDKEFRFVFVNKNKAIRHGIINPSDMNGKTDFDFISENDAKEIFEVEKSILETGHPVIGMTEKLTRLDGSTTWASSSKYPLYDEDGKIIGIWGISRDITEYELAKEALRESQERYSQLSEQSRTFTWEVDEQGLFTYVDHMTEIVLGYRLDELVYKMHFYDMISQEEREVIKQAVFDVFSQKVPFQNLEIKTQTKDGHTIWFSINGIPVLNGDGTLRGYRGSNTDITERKQIEEELQRNRRQLTDIIEFLPDATLAIDKEKRVIIWNKAIEEMTGITSAEMIGKGDYAYTVPFYGEAKSNMMDLVFLDDEEIATRYPNLTREGDTLIAEVFCPALYDNKGAWVFSKASPLHDLSGNIIGAIESIRDITERKQAEDALKDSEEKFRTYTEKAPLGIFVSDDKGRYIDVNPAACKLAGYEKDELLKLSIPDFLAPEHMSKGLPVFGQLLTQGYAEGDFVGRKKNEERFWFNLVAVKIADNRLIAFCKDITDQKEAEKQILYLNYHDQLTGLYNRRFYEEELLRLDTERNLPMSIIMGDVNGLKLINDSFGHAMGDELLKKAAEVIKKGCRADDIVARLGGDEFVILLPKTAAIEAEKLIMRINRLSSEEKVCDIDVSVSFGCKTKSDKEEKIQDVFKNAEDHMYRNKLSESSSMRSRTIDLIMKTLYEKYNREQLHSIRVSEICEAIASKMDFSKEDVAQIRLAGLMHDIGKIEIDGKILNKPKSLNNDEWEEMKRHPEIGYRILTSVNEFSKIADYVLEHQERWDGKGYPRGLKGEEILIQARIIAVADSFDAMTTSRSYGKELNEEEAINEIRRCSGTQFDPAIARVLIETILGKGWE